MSDWLRRGLRLGLLLLVLSSGFIFLLSSRRLQPLAHSIIKAALRHKPRPIHPTIAVEELFPRTSTKNLPASISSVSSSRRSLPGSSPKSASSASPRPSTRPSSKSAGPSSSVRAKSSSQRSSAGSTRRVSSSQASNATAQRATATLSPTDAAAALLAGNETRAVNGSGRFAYTFYSTDEGYHCHALVNAWVLRNKFAVPTTIDIVIVTLLANPPAPKVPIQGLKIKRVARTEMITSNGYYRDSYTKFDVLSLTEYDRIIFVDSDGLFLGNMDHLFTTPLGEEQMGAAFGWWFKGPWLTSMMFMGRPTKKWHQAFTQYVSRKGIQTILKSYKNHYDMEIFNYVLKEGSPNRTLLLPQKYAQLDAWFGDHPDDPLNASYYAHFSHRKPFYRMETRQYAKNPSISPFQSPPWLELFRRFWEYKDIVCSSPVT